MGVCYDCYIYYALLFSHAVTKRELLSQFLNRTLGRNRYIHSCTIITDWISYPYINRSRSVENNRCADNPGFTALK